MRRSDRLFEIIEMLRRARSPTPARVIAAALAVTPRTIYRDMVTLEAMRVPVQGEAGVGYILRPGYDLPPLMFTAEEIEAIVVGLSLLGRTGDAGLLRAADRVTGKVAAVLPAGLDRGITASPLDVSGWSAVPPAEVELPRLRKAIRNEQMLHLHYADAAMRSTDRGVRPIALIYYVECIVLAAWCDLRGDFRHFRADRIKRCVETGVAFKGQGDRLRTAWRRQREPCQPSRGDATC